MEQFFCLILPRRYLFDDFDLQYPLKHIDYTFTKYDSFLCASIMTEDSLNGNTENINCCGTTSMGGLKEHILLTYCKCTIIPLL
ncbi:MAG: hypothetical protein J6T70_06415 [Bacteroidales bacterium]|nr:hypothetical protein [Bacteroidales bacterium]MBO7596660.1 hypothetical protein [Bacteroidales bacterium]